MLLRDKMKNKQTRLKLKQRERNKNSKIMLRLSLMPTPNLLVKWPSTRAIWRDIRRSSKMKEQRFRKMNVKLPLLTQIVKISQRQ